MRADNAPALLVFGKVNKETVSAESRSVKGTAAAVLFCLDLFLCK